MEGISIRQTLILGCVVPLKELKQIADLYAVKVIDAANKANVGGPPLGPRLTCCRRSRR